MSTQQEYKINVYGSTECGTILFLSKFLQTEIKEEHPTKSISVYTKTVKVNDKIITLNIRYIDEGCNEELSYNILSDANAILFIFDITNPTSLIEITEKKNIILSHLKSIKQIPMLLVGNKYEQYEDNKSAFESLMKVWEESEQIPYMSISSIDVNEIRNVFKEICEMIEFSLSTKPLDPIKAKPIVVEPTDLDPIHPENNSQQLARREVKRNDYAKFFSRSTQNKKVFVDQNGVGHFNSMEWQPPCELLDCETHYLLKFEVPGIDKKSINLQYANNWIILSGNKELPNDGDYCFTEIFYGKFKREVPVPVDASQNGIQASYSDGILIVKLMKVLNNTWINVEIQ